MVIVGFRSSLDIAAIQFGSSDTVNSEQELLTVGLEGWKPSQAEGQRSVQWLLGARARAARGTRVDVLHSPGRSF